MRFRCVLFVVGCLLLAGMARPSWAEGWARTYGGSLDEYLFASASASDGGLLLVGTVAKSSGAGTDGWAVRVDAAGVPLWQKAFGGTKTAQFDAAVQTGDGGFVLAGRTDSFGAGMKDILLMKLDASGAFLWSRTYGGAKDDVPSALVLMGDGGFLVAGTTESFGAGNPDAWVIRTDASGVLQWQRSYGGAQWDYGYAIFPWGGGYILAGLTYTWGTYGDLWILKLDASGAPLWQKSYGSTQFDGLTSNSAAPTADGGFAVACSTEGFSAHASDFWVLKFSSAGDLQWQKRYGGADRDDPFALVALSDGGLAVAGTTFSFDMGFGDFWLLRLDASGGVLWQKSYGGTAADECWVLAAAQGGGFFAGGYTESFGAGGSDIFLLKLTDLGVVDGACVAGGTSTATPSVTAATGASTSVAGTASTATNPSASPTGVATTAVGPACAPTHTCTLGCNGYASPSSGYAPLTVRFTGSASTPYCAGSPAFAWDFGDGGTSTLQSPTHEYAAVGEYWWTLTVTVEDKICTKTGTVSVTERPPCSVSCEASATPASGAAPLAVQFAATADAPGCTQAVSFAWNFGDGATSTEQNPSHTYAAAGTYSWTLTASADGKTCAKTGGVTVTPPCVVTCLASAEPASGEVPLAVAFTSSALASNCSSNPSYAWDFGDGATSSQQNPLHTYQAAGSYGWTLTASADGKTCSKTGTVVATAPCALECAASATPDAGSAPLAVAFSASATPVGCSSAPSFSWTFGDGASSSQQNPTHTYASPGTYSWSLAVTADGAVCTRTGTVTVTEPCALECAASAVPASGVAPLQVAFEGSATASHCTGPASFTWAFGDGATSSEQSPAHTYASAGTYAWTLTVAAQDQVCSMGGTVTATSPCTITCDPSAAPASGPSPLAVTFASGATPSNCSGAPVYLWTFGDGAVSSEPSPTHTYAAAGSYAWTLLVIADQATCTGAGSVEVAPGVPGDCDADGEVSIGEVQKAINMFLGILAPACGADCNGDGEISIGEVQKVINAFLGLPSGC